jgi:hypothetical protein
MSDLPITIVDEPIQDELNQEPKTLPTISREQPAQVPAISIDLQALMSQAIDKGVSVEVMERLLAMWEKIHERTARKAYFDALLAFQTECPIIEKDTKVYDKYGNLRYKYAKIEKIIKTAGPLIAKHGFSYTIKPSQEGDNFTAIIVSTHTNGHTEETPFTVPINKESYMTAPQKVGEARTYAERGAFLAAYGILTADGDVDANDLDNDRKPITGQNGNEKQDKNTPPPSEKKSTSSEIPEDNKKVLSEIMSFVREKFQGKEFFPTKEQKEKVVKQANGAVMNLELLTAQRDALKKVIESRKATILAAGK